MEVAVEFLFKLMLIVMMIAVITGVAAMTLRQVFNLVEGYKLKQLVEDRGATINRMEGELRECHRQLLEMTRRRNSYGEK